MRIALVAASFALLAAVAGCGGGDDVDSDRPDPSPSGSIEPTATPSPEAGSAEDEQALREAVEQYAERVLSGDTDGVTDSMTHLCSVRVTIARMNELYAGIGPQVGTDIEFTSYKARIDDREATVTYSYGPEHPLLDAQKVPWYREDDGVWREDACMD